MSTETAPGEFHQNVHRRATVSLKRRDHAAVCKWLFVIEVQSMLVEMLAKHDHGLGRRYRSVGGHWRQSDRVWIWESLLPATFHTDVRVLGPKQGTHSKEKVLIGPHSGFAGGLDRRCGQEH